jgi:hypothetical protein
MSASEESEQDCEKDTQEDGGREWKIEREPAPPDDQISGKASEWHAHGHQQPEKGDAKADSDQELAQQPSHETE